MDYFSLIRQLPANSAGKDYVVGDLHGCFDLLERLLVHVNFDRDCDRLFSVGDLIDRGPNSMRCLALLAEPWFFAVRGNHEMMMLSYFIPYLINGKLENMDDINESGFLDNGGYWVEKYFQPDQQRMSSKFNSGLMRVLELPLMWVIGEGSSRFHIIHAELIKPDFRHSELMVWLDSDIDRWIEDQTIHPDIKDRLYWGRTLMSSRLVKSGNARIQPDFQLHIVATPMLPNLDKYYRIYASIRELLPLYIPMTELPGIA